MPQSNQATTTIPSAPPPPAAAELRDQIKTALQAAREAQAQDAAQAARDMAQLKRDAAQDARDAAQAARTTAQGGNQFTLLPPVPPPAFQDSFPPQIVDISIAFFLCCAVMVIGWPLARAFGKRIERRAETPAINPAMADQLQRIEQAVDAMSIEIERISESQRFMARLQNAQTPGVLPVERG